MRVTSYAQNFEDVMLWRALGHIDTGRYIDIGAQHPVVDSVSRLFYEHGWRGVHIEPIPEFAEQLRRSRPEEVVIQSAATDKNGIMTFYEFPDTGLSTADPEIADRHVRNGFSVKEIVISGATLDDIFAREPGEVHWLKIDVEGREDQVLRGWIHSPIRPWILVLESTLPLSQVESHERWESLVLQKGYKFAYCDGLNRFYISDRHQELCKAFDFPPNVFDDFSLSGRASSSFCAALNSRIQELENQIAQERQDKEKQLSDQLQQSHAESTRLSDILTQRQHEANVRERTLLEELHASQLQTQFFADRLAAREREMAKEFHESISGLAEQKAKVDLELKSARIEITECVNRLNMSKAEFAQLSQMFATSQREFSVRERELGEELRASQQQARTIAEHLLQRDREMAQQMAEAQSTLAAQRHSFDQELLTARQQLMEFSQQAQILGLEREKLRHHSASLVTLKGVCQEFKKANSRIGELLKCVVDDLQQTRVSFEKARTMSSRYRVNITAPGRVGIVEEMLSLHGRSFVNCVYKSLLHREPDSSGSHFYLERVRAGISKRQIIAEIAMSAEGKRYPVLPELQKVLRIYKLRTLPFVGIFISWVLDVNWQSRKRKRERALEEEIWQLVEEHEQNREQFSHIEARISDLLRFANAKKDHEVNLSSENHFGAYDDDIAAVAD